MRISVDDGCALDLRVAELCKKYSIDCIFYWPADWTFYAKSKGFEPLLYSDAYAIAQEFEIGSHTITHPLLTQITMAEAEAEISESKIMLESLFNTEVTKFCPPRGYTNPELTEYTLKYYDSQRLTKSPNLVHIHPDSGANDNKPWQSAITSQTKELWSHSWELTKYNLWGELESYLANTSC